MHDFDIIWILESKQVQSSSVPGFSVYQNESRHGKHRGGVMLLVKYSLQKFITNINLTLESQIWLELSCFPNTMFGGVYNPPDCSPYYEQSIIGNVYAQTNVKESTVVLGE